MGPGHYPAKYPVPAFFLNPFPQFVEYRSFESRTWIPFFIPHSFSPALIP